MEERELRSGTSSILDSPSGVLRSTPWRSWRLGGSPLFILIGTIGILAAWSNSFGPGADRPADVNWTLDNRYIIASDPRLRAAQFSDLPGQPGWVNIWTRDYWWPNAPSGLYRPVVTTSYWLNWRAAGDSSTTSDDDGIVRRRLAMFHATNLLAHLLVTILVYRVVLLIVKRWWPAAAAALLFALHPVTTEAVTNLVGRADLFAAIGVLGGLLACARAARAHGVRRFAWLFALALIAMLALFSKESAIAIVLVLPLYDVCFRWAPDRAGRIADLPRHLWRWFWTGYIALVPALLLLFAARASLFGSNPPPPTPFVDNPIVGASWIGGRITALDGIARMAGLLAWPWRLTCDYSFNQIPVALSAWSTPGRNASAITSALAVIALFVTALIVAIRFKPLRPAAFFVLFFFATALVTSNLLFPIGTIMAERFAYLPLVGFSACVALVIEWLFARRGLRSRRGPWLATILIVMIAGALLVRTYQRNRDWRSDVTLWKSALAVSSNSFRAYQSYSYALYEELRKPEALRQPETKHVTIDECIAVCAQGEPIIASLPDELNFSRIRLQLGMFYAAKAESLAAGAALSAAAREWFEKSVAALELARRADQAVNALNRRDALARGRDPSQIADGGNAQVYENLAYACLRLGRMDEALESYEYQRHLDPGNANVYERIAQVHTLSNRPADAAVALMQELFLDGSRRARVEPALMMSLQAANSDLQSLARPALLGLARIFVQARQPAQAEQIRRIGVQNRGMAPQEFDAIYRELGQKPPAEKP